VGKRFTARQFAKALNCRHRTDDSCDECANCRLIDQGQFPDFYVPARQGRRIIKGTTTSGGDGGHLVHIVSRLHFPPVMGRHKVVLIEPANQLTDEAGSMLLKILEEPPSQTVFILIATLETTVMPTLVSRCQKVRFPPLARDEVAAHLAEKLQLPVDLASSLAQASLGSIGRAVELNQSKTMEQRLTVVDYLLSLMDADLSDRVDRSMRLLASTGKTERLALETVSSIAAMFARDLLCASAGLGSETLLFVERAPEIERTARRLERQGALALTDVVRELSSGLGRNENPRHLLHYLGNRFHKLVHVPEGSQSR